MNFLKFVLATVLSVFLTGQALATEERVILAATASDDAKWNAYLEELAGQQPLEFNGKSVKGYDPETGLVSTGAVMQHYCFNHDPRVQKACEKPGEQYLRFVSRNGWNEIAVPAVELRQQARERKVSFPLTTAAATPVAAASAPPAAAVSTPVVTAEQLRALEQSFAQVKQALEAQAAGNASAIAQLQQDLAAKNRKVEELQQAQQKAPTPEQLVVITAQLTAETTARQNLERKLKEQVDKVAVAAGQAAASAAAPALARAADAEAAASAAFGRIGEVDDKATTAKREANTAKRSAEEAGGVASTARYLSVIALLAIIGVAVWLFVLRRDVKEAKAAQAKAEAAQATAKAAHTLAGGFDGRLTEVASQAQSAAGLATRSSQAVTGFRQELDRIVTQVQGHEEQLQGVGEALNLDLTWQVAKAEAEVINEATFGLGQGEQTDALSVTLPSGEAISIRCEGADDDHVIVHGIVPPLGQREVVVRKANILTALRKAYRQRRLAGIKLPVLSVVAA